MTASASSKAASICFDLAEFHKQRHQLDKVGAAVSTCILLWRTCSRVTNIPVYIDKHKII
jgi:hypothetical protein